MSKKSGKIAALIEDCSGHPEFDSHYLGYFKCFNADLYYEAHDVLEELWLEDRLGPLGDFYKGLIQFAGSFVHLQKGRIGPAAKLFALAHRNFARYPDQVEGLDLARYKSLSREYEQELIESEFTLNPLASGKRLRLELPLRRSGVAGVVEHLVC